MYARCSQLIPKSEERRGQGEACPASSLKLTNQISCCSFPSLSDDSGGEPLSILLLHKYLHVEGSSRNGEEMSSQECQTLLDMNKTSSGPGRNP